MRHLQVCASLVNDSACSNFSVVLFGYDTDYLYKGIQVCTACWAACPKPTATASSAAGCASVCAAQCHFPTCITWPVCCTRIRSK